MDAIFDRVSLKLLVVNPEVNSANNLF